MAEHNIKIELPEIFNAAVTPVASRASETLIALWDITFGGIDNYANKINFKRNLDLEAFKNELVNNLHQIPTEKIIEPKLSIIGPAIESSKYYYEEPELRNMFAKLIASSMNSEYKNIVRTSFTSIIKELEPIDASNLQILNVDIHQPIADIRYKNKISGITSTPVVTNLFLNNSIYSDHKLISSSLINLERLGLIEIIKNEWIEDESKYDKIFKSSIYEFHSSNSYMQSLKGLYDEIEVVKGYFYLTTLGEDFVKACF